MKLNEKLLPANTYWEGKQFNLFSGTGKTSELSFYGIMYKIPSAHIIKITGALLLRRDDGDLSNYYGGFPLVNLTQNVGVTDNSKLVFNRYAGSTIYGTNESLNGITGTAWLSNDDKNVHVGRIYDPSSGADGGWAWDTIGSQKVNIDWTIEYTD